MDYNFALFFGLLACFVGSSEAIVGAPLAPQNKYKYHVVLNIPGETHSCGGAIIDEHHILTAACCIIRRNEFVEAVNVLAGTNDLQQTGPPAQTVEVSKAYVPKKYRQLYGITIRVGDIAVLKLKNQLRMNITERPLEKVHLPSNVHESYNDVNATITGFGWDWMLANGLGGNTHTQLRHAQAAVQRFSRCRSVVPDPLVSVSQFCAKVVQTTAGIHGVCLRDIGGPLVFHGTIIGVLIFHPHDCSERRVPGVYTRVTEYLDFIHHATHDEEHKDIRIHDFHSST